MLQQDKSSQLAYIANQIDILDTKPNTDAHIWCNKTDSPKLQISATQSYPISWITSGAIQNGVPITVLRLAMVSCRQK